MYKEKHVHYIIGTALLILAAGASMHATGGPGRVGGLLLADALHPRPLGLANAFSAVANDESSMNTNPAGLVRAGELRINGGHIAGLAGTAIEHLEGVYNTGQKGAIGFQLGYLRDTQEGRDLSGKLVNSFTNSNLLGGLAYSFKLTPDVSMGLGVKGLFETYASDSQVLAAANIGIQARFNALRFGLHAQNLGGQLFSDFTTLEEEGLQLPLRVALGAAHPLFTPHWLVSAEYQSMPLEERQRIAVGTELWIHQIDPKAVQLALRLGYQIDFQVETERRVSAGAGIVFPPYYELNYAMVNFGALGSVHRFSLAVKFPTLKPAGPQGKDLKAVYGVKVIEDFNGITIKWNDPNDKVEGYHVYSDYGVVLEQITDAPVQGMSQKFIKITKGVTYNFYVRPIGSDKRPGPVSDVITWVSK